MPPKKKQGVRQPATKRKKVAAVSSLTSRQQLSHVESMVRYFNGLSRPTQTKSESEVAELRAASQRAIEANVADCACWFKDSNGGDFCLPADSAQKCKDDGGTPVPGDCPNFFAALNAAGALSGTIAFPPPLKGGGKRPLK